LNAPIHDLTQRRTTVLPAAFLSASAALFLSCKSDQAATTAGAMAGQADASATHAGSPSSAANGSSANAGAGMQQARSDAGTPGADGCCDVSGTMRCVDGAIARCHIDAADGCGTWQTFKTCARGCEAGTASCSMDSASSSGDDAGVPNAPDGSGTSDPPDVNALNLETQVVAAQVGYDATAAPGQMGALTGADLGWTFVHRDKLWVMFGDSWWIDPVNAASLPDDALGQISIADFPDGASVDAFVRAHPAPMGQPAWHAAAPTMSVFMRGGSGTGFAPVLSERDGTMVRSGIGFVPMTGFSNGRDDASEGVFAIFFSYEQVACESGRCNGGFECDSGLGASMLDSLRSPCIVGKSSSCTAGPGLCQDRSTSVYEANSDMGRTQAVVVRHDVGVTTPSDPLHFKTQTWETQRFFNATSRTITDFDPARAKASDNDYTPALGNTLTRSGVFVWGRPQFGGIGTEGRDAQLYLLWVPMPRRDADSHFDWKPQYFAGLDSQGRPKFSEREVDSQPLDLDASKSGEQPEEARDIVGQMGISWVPSLKHFVMFYGGEVSPMFAQPIFRDDIDKVRHDPMGSLFVRFAEHPWGPWTAPRPFLVAGDWKSDAEPIEQYAPGGILAHNSCRGDTCARYDPAYRFDVGNNNNGVLYGANIIDPWTTAHDGQTDLYWFVSTWNPYQVVLMKTSLSR
jgi:hypothetical protein